MPHEKEAHSPLDAIIPTICRQLGRPSYAEKVGDHSRRSRKLLPGGVPGKNRGVVIHLDLPTEGLVAYGET